MPEHTVTPAAPAARPAVGSLAVRLVLTLVGAAGLIIGALLEWLNDVKGIDGSYRIFYASSASPDVQFYKSAGFAMIVLGAVAILGLVPRSGWLTRLAGALGIIGFALFAINVYRRSNFDVSDFQIGIWLVLAGGLVALIGGFFGTRIEAVTTAAPATTAPTAPTYTE
jgi:hypothetical protein